MQPAIHIKKTIDFNKNFRSLLEVLKLVAVSDYHALEKKLKMFRELEGVLEDFFRSVDVRGIRHPFLDPGSRPMGVVAVTSDAGLLGGLNNQVVTKAVELARAHHGRLVVVGEKGLPYAQESGLPFAAYPGVQDDRRYAQALELRDYLIQQVVSGQIGPLRVVYPRAHSFVIHRVEIATFIPFKAGADGEEPAVPSEHVLYESDARDIVEYLAYLVFGQRLYEIFGMARVCEQAARYLHLEESCNKILEMNQKLLLQYFRRRHEVIDANMRELFAARSAHAD